MPQWFSDGAAPRQGQTAMGTTRTGRQMWGC